MPIAGAMHELRESAKVAEEAFRTIVAACTGHAYGVAPNSIVVKSPDMKELMRQNRVERERLRQLNKEQEGEREFWSKYLAKYRLLQKVEDYQSYLSLVGRLFGPIGPGEIVLDAGCGNGMFGLWVVRSLLEQNPKSDPPPLYVGLDLTLDGLRDAVETQAGYASLPCVQPDLARDGIPRASSRPDRPRHLGHAVVGGAGARRVCPQHV